MVQSNTKTQYNFVSPASLAFSGERRNGPPLSFPMSRVEVAQWVRQVRKDGLRVYRCNGALYCYRIGTRAVPREA